jgi:toxin ParE1/3/4
MAVRRLEVRYRPEALDDLEWIYRFVYRGTLNPIFAEKFVTRIRARCRRIGNAPNGGRPRDDLEPGLRTTPFERSAVTAYKVEEDCVRVTNVFYGGQDYESLYRGVDPTESDEP